MGIKSTMNAISYSANHVSTAWTKGNNVTSLHNLIIEQSTELLRDLNLMLSTLPNGDSNIATIQAQITALS